MHFVLKSEIVLPTELEGEPLTRVNSLLHLVLTQLSRSLTRMTPLMHLVLTQLSTECDESAWPPVTRSAEARSGLQLLKLLHRVHTFVPHRGAST